MSIHPDFPKSPYEILDPDQRWFPADEALRTSSYEKLIPPLVHKTRSEVKKWRDSNYRGASLTAKALLTWWFKTPHVRERQDGASEEFRYYFSQRESVETVIWLYEVAKVKDKYDLIRLDSSGAVSPGMFEEDWLRLVVKMATGSGKTKVISLLLTWAYFHKTYEEDSKLSTNFLIIAPNIIVLDRLRHDFDGLRIFHNDPLLPENGFEGKNWQDDFQLDSCTFRTMWRYPRALATYSLPISTGSTLDRMFSQASPTTTLKDTSWAIGQSQRQMTL